jgi:hypothetical protein
VLFEKLPVNMILEIFAALLMERRYRCRLAYSCGLVLTLCCWLCSVLLSASMVSVVSACTLGFTSLLHPLQWKYALCHHVAVLIWLPPRYIFIPVLPSKLLDYCTAPVPYFIGVLTASMPDILRRPLDETLIVDLDSRRYLRELVALRSILSAVCCLNVRFSCVGIARDLAKVASGGAAGKR